MTHPSEIKTVESRKSKIYVLPTRYGYIFIFVLAAMLLGSANYNNNLGFLLTFLLGAMATVSVFHACRNIGGTRVVSVHADPVFAGEDVVFECRVRAVENPAAAVRLAFGDNRSGSNDLETDAETTISVTLKTTARGLVESGPLMVYSRYPLGLFRAWMRMPVDARCLAYPRPVHGPMDTSVAIDAGMASGPAATRGVDDFQGLRPYQPGDSLQHISWKTFSRGQGLFTKQFSGQAGMSRMLDWESVTEKDVEKKLSRLCGMILTAHRDRMSYGLTLPGQTIGANRGNAHKHNCLKALALFGAP